MRVLLSTIGSRGDVQPLVALALQLRALGQDVRLCVPPDFRDWIEGLGIPVTPIGPEVRKARPKPIGRVGPAHARAASADDGRHGRHAVRDDHGGRPGLRRHRGRHRAADRRSLGRREAWGSPTSSPPTARPFCRRHTTRRPRCLLGHTPAPATADHRDLWARTRSAGTTPGARCSTPIGHRAAWRRSATCAATSSPTGPGWPPTRRWALARSRGRGCVPDGRLDPAG